MEVVISKCKCPHIIIKTKIPEKFQSKTLKVNILGFTYQLEVIKRKGNKIICQNQNLPLGKQKISFPNLIPVSSGLTKDGLLTPMASLNTNVESGWSARSFPNVIVNDLWYRYQTTPEVGVGYLPN